MIRTSRFIVVSVLLVVTGLYVNLHADITVPMKRSFGEFPLVVRGWRMTSQAELSEQVLEVLKPTDYLSRAYERSDGQNVQLYIGYHGGGREGGEIHSPKHCLPGSGWFEAASRRYLLDLGDRKLNLVRAVYQKGTNKVVFLYWYQMQERSLADEYSLKLAEIASSMLHRRRDAAFVRVSVPFETDAEQATARGEGFIRDLYPVIREFLPR